MIPSISAGVRIFAALALAALFALALYYAYDAGGDDREAPWLKREADRAAAAARLVREHDAELRATERAGAASVMAAVSTLQKENADAKAQSDRFVDDVLSGRIRVRWPPAGDRPDSARLPAPSAGTGGDAGAGACELPRAVAADLGRLASDADQVVRDLNACRAILRAERGG